MVLHEPVIINRNVNGNYSKSLSGTSNSNAVITTAGGAQAAGLHMEMHFAGQPLHLRSCGRTPGTHGGDGQDAVADHPLAGGGEAREHKARAVAQRDDVVQHEGLEMLRLARRGADHHPLRREQRVECQAGFDPPPLGGR